MNKSEMIKNINAIDMTLIEEKLLVKHDAETVKKIISSYKNYLLEAATSSTPVGPSELADEAWHVHILHMEKYMWDCVLAFGKILWHSPFRPQWDAKSIVSSGCSNVDCESVDCSNADGRFSATIVDGDLVIKMKKSHFNISDPKMSDIKSVTAFANA